MAGDVESVPQGFAEALDRVRRVTQDGVEYWLARELQQALGYDEWRNFAAIVERGKVACATSGVDVSHHFAETNKMVPLGSGATRSIPDYFLTRYACYLIAMNGDPAKREVGYAQVYFAVQTRRQELADQASEEDRRVELRRRVTHANRALASAASKAGVRRYPIFQDAGYQGLYGGLGLNQVKRHKGLGAKDDLLDRAGRVELAANEFRITQTEELLVRDRVASEDAAIRTHRAVGAKVRQSINDIGGTMPEHLPVEPSIKKIEARRKSTARRALRQARPN